MATTLTEGTLPALQFSLSPERVKEEADAVVAECTARLDAIAAAFTSGGASACTWERVVAPLAAMDRDLEPRVSALTFLKDASTDKAVRDASAAAQAALSAFEVKAGMRLDVFTAVRAYHETHFEAEVAAGVLDAEGSRFVERTMRDFRRRGLALPAEARAELEAVRTRASDLCVAFQQRLGEDETKLAFTRAQLAGMPPDFVASLKPAGGDRATAAADDDAPLEVTLAYPHVVPILKLCSVPATRAAVEKAFSSRGHPANTAALEELAELRRREAGLLGYASHAAFVLEERMAKTPADVAAFLGTLGAQLRPLLHADLAALAALKAAEEGPAAGPLTMADYRYYQEQELRTKYAVDAEALRAYFPLAAVLEGMLAIYEALLSLRITRLGADGGPEAQAVAAHVWHPDVALYAVHDAAPGGGGRRLGYFYLDLHPREGKYSHAAVFPLLSGCAAGDVARVGGGDDGGRVMPVCAMLCNFTKPGPGAPSLIRHEEVVTMFHEQGHVFHHLLSQTRFHRFASFRVEQDFVEAPSQALENWCWQPSMLARMSRHHATGEPLPAALAERLAASRRAHSGLFNTRQILLATFDQQLHTLPASAAAPPPVDTAVMLKTLHDDLMGVPMTPGTNFAASFGHLAGGYSSAYYGYLWSDVYAADIFATLFEADPLNAAAGLRYRRAVLEVGGSVDAAVFLRTLLGRAPSNAAFLRAKGLDVPAGVAA